MTSKTDHPVVDFHTHVYPEWLRDRRESYAAVDATFGELFADPKARMATADELVAAMDRDGVDRSVVMGVGWTDRGLAREANDYIIESVSRFPDRLTGFGAVNPAWGEDAAREAERCASLGLAGIGELHPDTQGYDLGDESAMGPLMEAVGALGLIVLTHSSEPVGHMYQGKGETRPEVLWRFIQNFPDATIVCAHWGGGLPFYALMPEVKEGLANVYFDTAASPFLYDRRVGSRRALGATTRAGAGRMEKACWGATSRCCAASRLLLRQIDKAMGPAGLVLVARTSAAISPRRQRGAAARVTYVAVTLRGRTPSPLGSRLRGNDEAVPVARGAGGPGWGRRVRRRRRRLSFRGTR